MGYHGNFWDATPKWDSLRNLRRLEPISIVGHVEKTARPCVAVVPAFFDLDDVMQ
jgi:hypothetical protein